jgi:hypothetical protein
VSATAYRQYWRTTCGTQKPYAAAMISIAWKSMIQDADSGDSRGNGGSRLWAISLGTFFLALKRKFLGGRTKTAKLKCYKISRSALSTQF